MGRASSLAWKMSTQAYGTRWILSLFSFLFKSLLNMFIVDFGFFGIIAVLMRQSFWKRFITNKLSRIKNFPEDFGP